MARFKFISLAVAMLLSTSMSVDAFMKPMHVLGACRDIDPLREKTDNITQEHYLDLSLMAVQGYMAAIKEQLIVSGRICLPYIEYWEIPIVVCNAYVDYVHEHGIADQYAYELVEDALIAAFACSEAD